MEVEAIQNDLQFHEIFTCNCIMLHDVTEVKEHRQTLDHFRWDMASNHSKIDLLCNKYQLVWYQISFALHCPYLHERLRVISCPLLKITTIWELSETWKGRNSQNSVPFKVSGCSLLVTWSYALVVNIPNNLVCASLSMFFKQVLVNPHYNMILECPFDHLMEQIRC